MEASEALAPLDETTEGRAGLDDGDEVTDGIDPRVADAPSARRATRLATLVALAVVVGWAPPAVGPALGVSTTSSSTPALLVPASGALFGAWVDPNGRWTGNADAEAEVSVFEKQLARRLDIDHHYYAWTDRFPSGLEQWDLANGRIPLISWKGTTLTEILSGRDDPMIRARAVAVRALRKPVFLRWGWEMNGAWSSWGGGSNGGGPGGGPAKYVAAWRHIHDIFRRQGATNVAWVWAPNEVDVPTESWNHWTNYYPGDAYVDWVGIDGFNWGTSQSWSSWRSLAEIIKPVYDDYASRKPIMVAETGSAVKGGRKAQWFTEARQALETQFPGVRAVVYFHAPGSPADWRVTTAVTNGSAFKAWAHDSYFQGSSQPSAPPVSGAFVWPNPMVHATEIAFTLGGASHVSIEIRDARGLPVRHIQTAAPWPSADTFAVKWDRIDDLGGTLPPGWYTAVVTATDGAGSTSQANCSFQLK